MTSRIRKAARPTTRVDVLTSRKRREMMDKLKLISEIQKVVEYHLKTAATARQELLEDMLKYGLTVMETPTGEVGEITQSAGKAKYTIDPVTLRKRLKDDKEFYACISVSVTKVKDFLSGKEYSDIAKFTPGNPGEKTLKVFKKEE